MKMKPTMRKVVFCYVLSAIGLFTAVLGIYSNAVYSYAWPMFLGFGMFFLFGWWGEEIKYRLDVNEACRTGLREEQEEDV